MYFFDNAIERRVNGQGIVDIVVNLISVMIHFSAAFGADHFGFFHDRKSERNLFAAVPKYFAHPDQFAEKFLDALLVNFAVFHVPLLIEQTSSA